MRRLTRSLLFVLILMAVLFASCSYNNFEVANRNVNVLKEKVSDAKDFIAKYKDDILLLREMAEVYAKDSIVIYNNENIVSGK